MREAVPNRDVEQAADILSEFGAAAVYVFGSVASGGALPDSDLDVAVSGLPPSVFFPALGRLMMMLSRRVDLIDLDQDTPFTRCLRDEGVLVRVR